MTNQILEYVDDGTCADDTLIMLTVKLGEIREIKRLINEPVLQKEPKTRKLPVKGEVWWRVGGSGVLITKWDFVTITNVFGNSVRYQHLTETEKQGSMTHESFLLDFVPANATLP